MARRPARMTIFKLAVLVLALAGFSSWALLSTAQTRRTTPAVLIPSLGTVRSVFLNGQSAGTVADLRPLSTKLVQLISDRNQKAVFLATDPTLPIAKFQELGSTIQKAGGEVYVRKTQVAVPSSTSQTDPATILVSTDGTDKIVVGSFLGSSYADNLNGSFRAMFYDSPVQGISLKVRRLAGSIETDAGGSYFLNTGPAMNLANANIVAFTSTQRPIEQSSLASGLKAILKQHAGSLQSTEAEMKDEDPTFAENMLKQERTKAREICIIVPTNATVASLLPIFDAAHDLDVSFRIIVKPAGH